VPSATDHPLPYPTRLVLTGFMGSGKSTVGRLLAAGLNYGFFDLDTEIEAAADQTVPEIFAAHGEAHFRTLEHAALAHALTHSQAVIALGGGGPETPASLHLLAHAPDTAVLYLAAPFPTLYDRCLRQAAGPSATARPNLATHAAAQARFTRREPLYTRLATHIFDTGLQTPEETTAAILAALLPASR
jgi:shikimate kinase